MEKLQEKKLTHAKKMIRTTYEEALNHYYITKQWIERMPERTKEQQIELSKADKIVNAQQFLKDDNEYKMNVMEAVKIYHRVSREEINLEISQIKFDIKKNKYNILTNNRKQKLKEYEAIIDQCKRNVLKAINDKEQSETRLLKYISEKESVLDRAIDKNGNKVKEPFNKRDMNEVKNGYYDNMKDQNYNSQIPSANKLLSDELLKKIQIKEIAEKERKKSTRSQMTNMNKRDSLDQATSFTSLSNHAKKQVDKVMYASIDTSKKMKDREKKFMQDLSL
ncbi:hypothetical protein HAX42_14555 [Enterococcus casseliflavus]|nr:hypothetical protein [Enterococcus casseliflavus]